MSIVFEMQSSQKSKEYSDGFVHYFYVAVVDAQLSLVFKKSFGSLTQFLKFHFKCNDGSFNNQFRS